MATKLEPTVTRKTSWQIDAEHTSVEFDVKHLMISTVKGRFGEISGSLKGSLDDPSRFKLEVVIPVESIDTRQAQRDAHLKSADFFDAESFPVIRFASKRIKGDVFSEFSLIGDLTIRDVTRDPWGNDRVGFSAKTKIDRRDFGLTWNQALETGGFVVGDEIRIAVDVEFTAQAE